ncbi:unnamed protein product (plasmid) [Mycetohabitans rhizoxinica HKI 454]|uniref:Uncharacterized protein n=1 Tax=Mycetohabitans rhizoxinica (strain DSM 19002 / CIP 109453 / HKI 454) TaxID=882378 RepID=E5ATX4_MYCRK|nr:unnamed protein product [Mycetohabitans rhizoxinica HKI 454]
MQREAGARPCGVHAALPHGMAGNPRGHYSEAFYAVQHLLV